MLVAAVPGRISEAVSSASSSNGRTSGFELTPVS